MAISNPSNELSSLESHQGSQNPRPSKHGWVWFLVLVLLAGGGYYYYSHYMRAADASAPADVAGGPGGGRGGRGGRGGGAFGAIPVAVTSALQQDVPYYLPCLGTVTAFNTVTVKTRVDGELQKVYFTEGQFVKQGDLLAEIDPRPYEASLAQVEGQLARDQANVEDANKDKARYEQLTKEGVIAQQQLDTQTSTVGQLEGALRADQANIDTQKLNILYSKITAPISGRVGLRLVDQGNIVHAADQNGLVVITQVQPIAVIFTVPEDNLPDVVKHMNEGQLSVVAYNRDDQSKLATGKLATIDNQIDPTTGTVKLKAVFDNDTLALWPNQFVNIRLMLDVRHNATVIPAAAVQTGAQGPYVYTVKNNTAQLHNVKVDVTQGNVTLIASGVVPGDEVVVDGQDKLQSGTSVVPHSTNDSSSSDDSTGNPQAGSNGNAAPGPGAGRGSRSGGGNGGPGGHNGRQGNGGPKGGPTT